MIVGPPAPSGMPPSASFPPRCEILLSVLSLAYFATGIIPAIGSSRTRTGPRAELDAYNAAPSASRRSRSTCSWRPD